MPSLALYRKYRPVNFSDVVGQETITRILKNQIKNDRVGHAYLFSGIRGTGKTSIAKIFARAVNCEQPVDGEACGTCESCQHMLQENNMNIFEIDAASNRGIDEIRNLRETIAYPPSIGKYKVYIIDEVHMLTKEAFNALLKTLEEPPPHALFLLATTEVHKLPATILSRCQRFNIKPISDEMIMNRLSQICEKENINIEPGGLMEIARRGEHALRDSISLLDQCSDINDPGELITEDEILDFLGISPKEQLIEISKLIAEKNGPELLKNLNNYRSQGREDSLLLEDLSQFFQSLLYYKLTHSKDKNFDESFTELENSFSEEELYRIIDTLVRAYSKLKFNSLSEIVSNTALLSLCSDNLKEQVVSSRPKITLNRRQTIIPSQRKTPRARASGTDYGLDTTRDNQHRVAENQNVSQEAAPFSPEDDFRTHRINQERKAADRNFKEQYRKLEKSAPQEDREIIHEKNEVNESVLSDKRLLKSLILDEANKLKQDLLRSFLSSADFRYVNNRLYILLDDDKMFFMDTNKSNIFYNKVCNFIERVLGKGIEIRYFTKKEYFNQMKKRQSLRREQQQENSFSMDEHIRKLVGKDDIKYTKIAD